MLLCISIASIIPSNAYSDLCLSDKIFYTFLDEMCVGISHACLEDDTDFLSALLYIKNKHMQILNIRFLQEYFRIEP